jgi:hypothetical protein
MPLVAFCVLAVFGFLFVCFCFCFVFCFHSASLWPHRTVYWSSNSTAAFGSSSHQDGRISNCINGQATCTSVLIDQAKAKRRWTEKKAVTKCTSPGVKQE